jgi:hypothetical protein
MARGLPDTLDLQAEGLSFFSFSATPRSAAAVRLGAFSIVDLEALGHEQIEPLQMVSTPRARPVQATRVLEDGERQIRMPWAKKAPALYQVTGLVTLMLATSGLPTRTSSGDARAVSGAPAMAHQHKAGDATAEGVLTETPVSANRARVGRLVVIPVDEPPYTIEDLSTWPDPSPRPTTIQSARALRDATREDPAPTLPPLVTDDGLGI